jgi:hypothetical protein
MTHPTPFKPLTAPPDAPHCRHELAVIAVVIPADAAHVQTPEVITMHRRALGRQLLHDTVVCTDDERYVCSGEPSQKRHLRCEALCGICASTGLGDLAIADQPFA